jgi:DNA-binding MarR family transcriptional regulator
MTTTLQKRRRGGGDPKPGDEALALGPLSHLLGYALRRAQIGVFADFIAAFAALDLRPAQYSALVLIDANPGCKQSEAAEALGIMQPNFVALMDDLEAGGLAVRAPSKSDRRSHALELTNKGRAVLRKAGDVIVAHEARVTDGLEPHEKQMLLALLEKVEQTTRSNISKDNQR